jgi:hypothetical protein
MCLLKPEVTYSIGAVEDSASLLASAFLSQPDRDSSGIGQ